MSAQDPLDRTPLDALRSVKRYVAVGLGDAYEVRLTDEEGAFRRPYALVAAVGATMYSGPAKLRDAMQSYAVALYPLPGVLMDDSLINAMEDKELLDMAFAQGVDEGKPFRVPLYDYYGVSLRDSVTVRQPRTFLRVGDYSSEISQEPEDFKLMIVNVDLRVAWRRTGTLSSPERTVERVTIEEQTGG